MRNLAKLLVAGWIITLLYPAPNLKPPVDKPLIIQLRGYSSNSECISVITMLQNGIRRGSMGSCNWDGYYDLDHPNAPTK